MKYLWRYYTECGRHGCIESLFTATEDEVNDLIGKQVYFGEILGKHSEVYGVVEESEIERIDIDPEVVAIVSERLGRTWSGYNPLDYVTSE